MSDVDDSTAGSSAEAGSSGPALLDELLGFCGLLRAEGLSNDAERVRTFCEAVAELGPENCYWAGRTILTSEREDGPTYDRVFRRYWRARGRALASVAVAMPAQETSLVAVDGAGLDPPGDATRLVGGSASPVEALGGKSAAGLSPEAQADLQRLYRRLVLPLPSRTTPRLRPASTGTVDLARTIRSALRTAGEPVPLSRARRRRRPRPLALLIDVSRSMAQHSERMAVFAHSMADRQVGCEVFCFGTHATHVTPSLLRRSSQEALAQATTAVTDWNGGTRIGESLAQLLADPRHAARLRGTVCVVVSDGLDTGDPELIGSTVARLRRLSHRLIWMNPFADEPGYAPRARAMQAALPHLDAFVSGSDLSGLAAALSSLQVGSRRSAFRPVDRRPL
ncbi:vWA domain-containing protein [Pseudonocardia xishanensis]|uniref:VWA domain-containing protein n=1 Tax=Pseudonocardia xishanensis TaxID=630995 RepID=A0ABP8S1E9_9PSEU